MARELSIPQTIQIYLRFVESLVHQKETEERYSEQRFTIFLTMVTLTFGILSYLAKDSGFSDDQLRLAGLVCAFVLFLFGLTTFARVIWCRREIDRIDDVRVNVWSAIGELDPHVGATFKAPKKPDAVIGSFIDKLKGTLAQFLYITQFLLAFAWVYLAAQEIGCPFPCRIVIASLVATVVFGILYLWAQRIRKLPEQV